MFFFVVVVIVPFCFLFEFNLIEQAINSLRNEYSKIKLYFQFSSPFSLPSNELAFQEKLTNMQQSETHSLKSFDLHFYFKKVRAIVIKGY